MDTCAHLTPRVPYTTCTRLPYTCPWLYLTGLHQSPPTHVTGLDFWSSHTIYGHSPSHYVLAPHSFYNYIRIRTHHVSNQHVTVISPDHRHAHILCCIITVISPRNLLLALDEHPEATFSPPTCASIFSPII
jgi:hypothetical protein